MANNVPVTSPAGRILHLGRGDDPSLAVDPQGTAHVVWSTPHAGRTGDDVVYCQLPRGATSCAVRRQFTVDALQPPVILRDNAGNLRVVVSYNGPLQLGGGTLIMSSADNGASWGYQFVPINTGIFQGGIVDATLGQNGRVLYAIFGDFVPGDTSQTFAQIGLDRPIANREDDPGRIGPLTGDPTADRALLFYSVRTVATLPDGRVVLAGYDTRSGMKTPRSAIRVVADADDNPVSTPWTPITGGAVFKLAASPRGSAMLTSPNCERGLAVAPVRGLRLGPPRPVGSERFLACNGTGGDLFVDNAGGRHVVYGSDEDGCQGTGPHENDRTCLIYRRARPGGDFGPKTTIFSDRNPFFSAVRVGTGADGLGWISWRELTDAGGQVEVTPTFTSSEKEVGKSLMAMTFAPSSECAKQSPVNVGIKVSGPLQDRPRIASVTWSTTPGLLPRRQVDSSAPYAVKLKVDRRQFYGLSSTGDIVFSMTARATVKYRTGGRTTKTAKLSQVLSFFCGVPFSRVRG